MINVANITASSPGQTNNEVEYQRPGYSSTEDPTVVSIHPIRRFEVLKSVQITDNGERNWYR